MDLKRLIEIIEAYGSKTESWPLEERESAIRCLTRHPEAQEYRVRQNDLDVALDEIQISNSNLDTLSSNILAKIELNQLTLIDQLFGWLFPIKPLALWQPALVSALPITIGIFLGSQLAVFDAEEQWNKEWNKEWNQAFYLDSFSNISFDLYPSNLNSSNLNSSNWDSNSTSNSNPKEVGND